MYAVRWASVHAFFTLLLGSCSLPSKFAMNPLPSRAQHQPSFPSVPSHSMVQHACTSLHPHFTPTSPSYPPTETYRTIRVAWHEIVRGRADAREVGAPNQPKWGGGAVAGSIKYIIGQSILASYGLRDAAGSVAPHVGGTGSTGETRQTGRPEWKPLAELTSLSRIGSDRSIDFRVTCDISVLSLI